MRYAAVARAAEELLGELRRSHRVLVTSVLLDGWPDVGATRLTPAGDGSPLTVGVLPDGRVVARRGHWDQRRFDDVDALRAFVAETVAGTFVEELTDDALVVRSPSGERGDGLREPEVAALARRAKAGKHAWPAWRG